MGPYSNILRATISARGVERYKLIPIHIGPDGAPRLIWNQDRKETFQFVERISVPIWEGRISEEGWFEQMAGTYLSVHLRAWIKRVRVHGVRHLMQFLQWLVSGFSVKCYLGLLRKGLRLHE